MTPKSNRRGYGFGTQQLYLLWITIRFCLRFVWVWSTSWGILMVLGAGAAMVLGREPAAPVFLIVGVGLTLGRIVRIAVQPGLRTFLSLSDDPAGGATHRARAATSMPSHEADGFGWDFHQNGSDATWSFPPPSMS